MRPIHPLTSQTYQAPRTLYMSQVVSPKAAPTSASYNSPLSPGLPPTYSSSPRPLDPQTIRPILNNVTSTAYSTYPSAPYVPCHGLPQNRRSQLILGALNGVRQKNTNDQIRVLEHNSVYSNKEFLGAASQPVSCTAVLGENTNGTLSNSFSRNMVTSLDLNTNESRNLKKMSSTNNFSQLSGQRMLQQIGAKVDAHNRRAQFDYDYLINPVFANFMDRIIDSSIAGSNEQENKKQFDIFKIPKPAIPKISSQPNENYNPQQKGGHQEKRCNDKESKDSNEQFDRGKTNGPFTGINGSLDPFKNYTEWKKTNLISLGDFLSASNDVINYSSTEQKTLTKDASHAYCSNTGETKGSASMDVYSEKDVVSYNKTNRKRKVSTLDFKDYTEWINFMDSGTLTTSLNNEVKNNRVDPPKQKKRKVLPDTVIVIDDDAEDLAKEKFWAGADNVKSCLGMNLKIPRPRQLIDDTSKKRADAKGSSSKNGQMFSNARSSCSTNLSTTEENKSKVQKETTKNVLVSNHKQNHNEGSMHMEGYQPKTRTERDENEKTVEQANLAQSEGKGEGSHTQKFSDKCSHYRLKDAPLGGTFQKDSAQNLSGDDNLRNTYRNIVLNMSDRPMRYKTADTLVTEILKEENLSKSTEELTNLIVKLVRQSTNQS